MTVACCTLPLNFCSRTERAIWSHGTWAGHSGAVGLAVAISHQTFIDRLMITHTWPHSIEPTQVWQIVKLQSIKSLRKTQVFEDVLSDGNPPNTMLWVCILIGRPLAQWVLSLFSFFQGIFRQVSVFQCTSTCSGT